MEPVAAGIPSIAQDVLIRRSSSVVQGSYISDEDLGIEMSCAILCSC